ncbi:MAG: hypothetical protein R3Y59_05245 [bacterium]
MNNDSEIGGCILPLVMWGMTIFISIYSGIYAWDLINPDGFGSAILFLIAWAIASHIGHFIAMGIVALLSYIFSDRN